MTLTLNQKHEIVGWLIARLKGIRIAIENEKDDTRVQSYKEDAHARHDKNEIEFALLLKWAFTKMRINYDSIKVLSDEEIAEKFSPKILEE